MTDAEKAFEYDRAIAMLRRWGRNGGLNYEILRMIERLDVR